MQSHSEGNALLESGWWCLDFNITSDHCRWPGITCNQLGAVVEISPPLYCTDKSSIRNLNFSYFPNLIRLVLDGNGVTRSIPHEIGNLSPLVLLNLSYNHLLDQIPSALGLLTNLTHLDLTHNSIFGPIPSTIGLLANLKKFSLADNPTYGYIPPEIGNLKNLHYLDTSRNQLIGEIPSFLSNLIQLESLRLHENQINGSIPNKIGNSRSLSFLSISRNQLMGPLPSSLDNLTKFGEIPSTIGNLRQLNIMDLSYNNLSGQIPDSVACLPSRPLIIVNDNSLLAKIHQCSSSSPDQLSGNDNSTCHGECFRPHKANVVLHYMEICIPVGMFLVFSILGFLFLSRKASFLQHEDKALKNGDVFSMWNYDGKIAFENIIEATQDFDFRYCIGTGGYGSVYRAQLPGGKVVALKKLHGLEAEEPTFDKCFKNEVKMLTGIRHKNIVKLHGFCLHKRSMLLVYEYVERGSLFCMLRNDDEAVELDWAKRISILRVIANALSYIHEYSLPIVHRDISSNIILLNSEMEGFLSGF
ncbi:serine-threonine protein kinase, plant-type, putative [Ricinus communis]|uniref:non-specific serine/threonine protein kinase n=1 Tax=Ricinus communis TaxID=3988 RepID=B9S9R2_RICCO|nr:serine-threonine protein kinase, plant-type, putative [Ricinus communis]